MKRYIFFIALAFTSALCLAPSKKTISNKSRKISQQNIQLKEKINAVAQSIGKPFNFDPDTSKSLSDQYIQWVKTLSKADMLKIIAYQERAELGFSKSDAQEMINGLRQKPFSVVYDVFMQYQKQLVVPDMQMHQYRTSSERLHNLHQTYQEEQDQMSYVRRLPIIHNLEVKLLPDITKLTDQELYEKIAQEMRRIGFSQHVIQEEQNNLKKNSVEILQRQMPHLQDELAKRLLYFNGTKADSPHYVVNADYYVSLMHTWTTTAASLVASGASLFGLNPLALQMIASSNLLNPYIGQKQDISKRQMLAMIYAQYKNYDALQDMYLNPNFKEIELLSKSEILKSIQENMEKIGMSSDVIAEQMGKYKKLKKPELEAIAGEFKYFGQNYQDLAMSDEEKRIEALTKDDLVDEIKKYVSRFSIPKEQQKELLTDVQKEDINFARIVLLDLMKTAAAASDKKDLKMPQVLSTKEKFIIKSPKIVSDAIADRVIAHLQHEWQQEGRSKMYQYWRTQALKNKLAQKEEGIVEHVADAYNRMNLARSVIKA